ncbi:thiopurine S-methyltransferase [Legionella taurinensis]|uniref:Thiopurine S-methyltransferase n=1 Tax=Legionella taurinensis TaxID=70611 RepID=A0A3A5L6U5_9GAMM|nr:thiopurine S-methyltransferase [Legionella taurinensis]MDX1835974.1 thiopurine S-methyltransferase [Legionella taurinensis]PUT38687.1 thiopurine S-methyltransferase [Legionella taurinensis]PUT40066.1 thiopurine S-methyltransferase [Legionella taurinensis]PUT42218.1 thiopurine S-methyltransferase [Legionella taurinensis]PUT45990.1 thiopurine S-methyltransferase [Legionella taurinensis]
MNKGKQFWHALWESGNLPFHRPLVNDDLIQFWPSLQTADNPSILVPLCGKSLDLLWLVDQGATVTGIELSELAVQQLAAENHLPLKQQTIDDCLCYSSPALTLWVHDLFTLPQRLIEPAEGLYDRGALVALPAALRAAYTSRCLQWLKSKGRILLKTLTYNQTLMEGPPYSVTPDELAALYPGCTLHLLKESHRRMDESDSLFVRGLREVIDYVWLIERN